MAIWKSGRGDVVMISFDHGMNDDRASSRWTRGYGPVSYPLGFGLDEISCGER